MNDSNGFKRDYLQAENHIDIDINNVGNMGGKNKNNDGDGNNKINKIDKDFQMKTTLEISKIGSKLDNAIDNIKNYNGAIDFNFVYSKDRFSVVNKSLNRSLISCITNCLKTDISVPDDVETKCQSECYQMAFERIKACDILEQKYISELNLKY